MGGKPRRRPLNLRPERPTLCYEDPLLGGEVTIAFGYFKNEPMMAFFPSVGLPDLDGNIPLRLLLPREVALVAALEGWGAAMSDPSDRLYRQVHTPSKGEK